MNPILTDTNTPSGPNSSTATLEHYITLIVLCCVGYLGRALSKKLLQCLSDTCFTGYCNTSVSSFTDSLVVGSTDGASGVTLAAVEGRSISWTNASRRLHHNYCAALSISLLRLVFFHWTQPIGYTIALYMYWRQLTQVQFILGCVVLLRELIYIVLTLIACCVNPAFLLVDSSATLKSSGWNLLLYIVCPEKFVYFCLGIRTNVPLCFLILCDLSGVAALCVAIYTNNMPVPLMIGYSITTLGGVAAFIAIVFLPLLSSCGCTSTSVRSMMMAIVNGTSRHQRLDLSCTAAEEMMDGKIQ